MNPGGRTPVRRIRTSGECSSGDKSRRVFPCQQRGSCRFEYISRPRGTGYAACRYVGLDLGQCRDVREDGHELLESCHLAIFRHRQGVPTGSEVHGLQSARERERRSVREHNEKEARRTSVEAGKEADRTLHLGPRRAVPRT